MYHIHQRSYWSPGEMCVLKTCLLRKDVKYYAVKNILSQLMSLQVISVVQANGKFPQEGNHKLDYITQ